MVQSVNYPGDPHKPGGSAFLSWGQLEEQQEQGCDSRAVTAGWAGWAAHPAPGYEAQTIQLGPTSQNEAG